MDERSTKTPITNRRHFRSRYEQFVAFRPMEAPYLLTGFHNPPPLPHPPQPLHAPPPPSSPSRMTISSSLIAFPTTKTSSSFPFRCRRSKRLLSSLRNVCKDGRTRFGANLSREGRLHRCCAAAALRLRCRCVAVTRPPH